MQNQYIKYKLIYLYIMYSYIKNIQTIKSIYKIQTYIFIYNVFIYKKYTNYKINIENAKSIYKKYTNYKINI